MSVSSAQACKFYEQTVCEGKVFTFESPGGLLVFPIRDVEVVPFWSSRSRLERIQATMPQYSDYTIQEKSFDEFYNDTLPWLEEQNIHIGVNWSGTRLTGCDLSVSELRTNLDYWRNKK